MLLVTGGAGFIGSNFIKYVLQKYPEQILVNLDSLTYAGNLENLDDINKSKNYVFVKGDITDKGLVSKLFRNYHFKTVINFAAESHVDRSIDDPSVFFSTNVLGTQVLLDIAIQFWKKSPVDKYCRDFQAGTKFIQISTDEVYGSLGEKGMFTELTPLSPNSPYAASKASADLLVLAYNRTYNLPVNITRCSNNYGPYQFPEKLIPLMINNCLNDQMLPVYGDGLQIRDWLHVEDHCKAIDIVWKNGTIGEVYNIGGNNEITNIELVKLILGRLDKTENLIIHIKDRLGHDKRYAIDSSKIKKLGWQPVHSFVSGLDKTIKWYLDNRSWLNNVVSKDYRTYYEKTYHNTVKL